MAKVVYMCKACGNRLKITTKHKINYHTYKCEKCGIYYFRGEKDKRLIIKDGIKYYNLND